MVACGTLKGQCSLDNSSIPLTQRLQAQGRMAELEVECRLPPKTQQEQLPASGPAALHSPADRGAPTRPVAGSA
jgi:hypothetical protein